MKISSDTNTTSCIGMALAIIAMILAAGVMGLLFYGILDVIKVKL